MSWSFTARVEPGSDVRESLDAARVEQHPDRQALAEAESETILAIDGAINAAVAMAEAVRGARAINVTLSGHTNPQNRPLAGYANDTVTVSIQQSYE